MASNQQHKFSETYVHDMGRGDFSSQYFELENEKRAKFLKQKKKLLDKLGLELVLEGADKKNKLTSGSTSGHNPMKRSTLLTTAGVDHEDQHLFKMASTSNVSIAGAGTEDEIGVAVTAGGREEQAVHEITEDLQRQRILRDHAELPSVGAAANTEVGTSGKKLTAQLQEAKSRRSSPPPPACPSYTPKKTHLTTDDRITEIFQTVLCKKQLDKTKGNFYRSDSRVGTWKELQPGDEAAPSKILPTASEMKATAANMKRSQSPIPRKNCFTVMILQDLHHKFVTHDSENLSCALPKEKHAGKSNALQV